MPSDDEAGWLTLDPRTLVLAVLQAIGQSLIPVILVLVFSMGPAALLLITFFGLPIVGAALRYAFFSYRLDPEEIVVREGVLHRTVRHIPYSRIQNLDTSEGVAQRLLGLVQVSLETAGGKEPEGRFRWIARARYEEMKARIVEARARVVGNPDTSVETSRRRESEGAAVTSLPTVSIPASDIAAGIDGNIESPVLYRVALADLLLLGVFSGRGLVILGALLGTAVQFNFLEYPVMERWFESQIDRRFGITEDSLPAAFLVLLAAIGSATALVTVLSVALTMTAYFGFTLRSGPTSLYTQSGLTTRQTSTIRRRRIQIMQILSPPLLRWFGRAQLRAGTAGSRDEKAASRAWLAPIAPEAFVAELVRKVQPETSLDGVSWRFPHRRAAARLRWRALFFCAILVTASLLVFELWGLAALFLVPLAWLRAGRAVRHHGHAMTGSGIYARRGWLWRRLEIVRFEKIQSVRIVESPVDRWWGMATLHVDTASIGGLLEVQLLGVNDAVALQKALTDRAGRSGFRW